MEGEYNDVQLMRKVSKNIKGGFFMKKRILSLLFCAMFSIPIIAASLTPAMAYACPHTSTKVVREVRQITPHTETQHKVDYKTSTICNDCHAVLSTNYGFNYESHSMRTLKSTHNSSNGTHTYRISCSACGYFRTETIPCSGPPCYDPF